MAVSMRRLLWLILLLCVPSFAAQTVVQYVTGQGSTGGGGTLAVTLTSTGSGHMLFVWAQTSLTTTAPTFVDSGSETYTPIINSSSGCYETQFTTNGCLVSYLCNSASGITSVTMTSSTFTNVSLAVMEVSGLATTSCLDLDSPFSAGTYGASPWASASISATAGDFVLGLASNSNTSGTPLVVNGSWTNANAAPGSAPANNCNAVWCNISEYQTSVAGGSIAAGGTATSGGGAAAVFAFLNGSGGGGNSAHSAVLPNTARFPKTAEF